MRTFEIRRRRKHTVQCQWAGCRAPELADKIKCLGDELRELRHAPGDEALDEDSRMSIRLLFTDLYAAFQLKSSWVFELPYFIWSVNSPATAQRFLEAYDRQVDAGELVHRVTEYIAGSGPWSLRREMEVFARGEECPIRLWLELRDYHLCPIDETPVEAVHRDVSRICVRATGSALAFKAASLRSQQVFPRWTSSVRSHGD